MDTTATSIRGELKRYIDTIPDYNLEVVRPILSFLAKTPTTDDSLVIETDLTNEEKDIITAGRRERKEHPENFTPWREIRRG